MKGDTIIFPHVPKAGGTSIKTQIEQSGLKTFMDYDAPPGVALWPRMQSERRNTECGLLDFSNFDIVFGHFPVERYDRPGYRYVALVRDPYSRIISQLNYLISRARKGPRADPQVAITAKLLESGELSPSEWVKRYGLRSIYRQYLGYWPKERFSIVGDTSRYASFVEQLGEMTGITLDPEVRERQNQGSLLEVTDAEEKKIRWWLRDEYDWYNAFVGDDSV
jgi:hypothetical protein